MNPYIKYLRFEDKKIILVPSKIGIDIFKAKDAPRLRTDSVPEGLVFKQSTEPCGGVGIVIFEVTLPAEILHSTIETNISNNTLKCRWFTRDQTNWYMNINCGSKEVTPDVKVVTPTEPAKATPSK